MRAGKAPSKTLEREIQRLCAEHARGKSKSHGSQVQQGQTTATAKDISLRLVAGGAQFQTHDREEDSWFVPPPAVLRRRKRVLLFSRYVRDTLPKAITICDQDKFMGFTEFVLKYCVTVTVSQSQTNSKTT